MKRTLGFLALLLYPMMLFGSLQFEGQVLGYQIEDQIMVGPMATWNPDLSVCYGGTIAPNLPYDINVAEEEFECGPYDILVYQLEDRPMVTWNPDLNLCYGVPIQLEDQIMVSPMAIWSPDMNVCHGGMIVPGPYDILAYQLEDQIMINCQDGAALTA